MNPQTFVPGNNKRTWLAVVFGISILGCVALVCAGSLIVVFLRVRDIPIPNAKSNKVFTQNDLARLVLQTSESPLPQVSSKPGCEIFLITVPSAQVAPSSLACHYSNYASLIVDDKSKELKGEVIASGAALFLDAPGANAAFKVMVSGYVSSRGSASPISGLGDEGISATTTTPSGYFYLWRVNNVILLLFAWSTGQEKGFNESEIRALANTIQSHTR